MTLITLETLRRIVDELVAEETELFLHDLHEVCISHRLARRIEIEIRLTEYTVDVEYNRNAKGEDIVESKKLSLVEDELRKINHKTNETGEYFVRPDIIIHKRMTDENIVILEVCKDTKDDDLYRFDQIKVREYVNQLHYRKGFLVKFGIKKETGKASIEEF